MLVDPDVGAAAGWADLGGAPATRYQGSKLKLLPWIGKHVGGLDFTTALDAFGGTGSVSYLLKAMGKSVTFNDYLLANVHIGRALIENGEVTLPRSTAGALIAPASDRAYDTVITRNFEDIYFTAAENNWLDVAAQNIGAHADPLEQSLAYYALFQACLSKRPYNLFHRRNLYIRTAAVERSFGNKATWDKPFDEHFHAFVRSVNWAVFRSERPCAAVNHDAREVPGDFDLVYVDSPYISGSGVGVNYFDFYHFLEGLTTYGSWESRIDRARKHLPLLGPRSPWTDKRQIHAAFRELFERYQSSTLVVSYRSDGIPSEDELLALLSEFKRHVTVHRTASYQYALSTNRLSQELLIVAQ